MSAQAPEAPRRWIACADDFAIDAGAIDGIAELLERGRLTATSCLVDAPSWPAAARALPRRDGYALGLHLNLTQAFAGGAATVWPLGSLLLRCAARALAPEVVRAQIERQLDAFEHGAERAPDYVDGHQHVHQLPGVREPLLAALQARYGAASPWLRSTRCPPRVRDPKARFIASLGDQALRRAAARQGRPMSAYLAGVYDFRGGARAYRERLRAWLAAGPDGTVLMCHPARSAPPDDPIGAARTVEYEVLASDEYLALLAAENVVLTASPRPLAS